MSEPRLTLDVIPSTCHFSNLRTHMEPIYWDRIRRKVYRRARYVCEICGGVGDEHPVEAHEKWSYETAEQGLGYQTLEAIEALCPACHEVKHYGLAQVRGRDRQARGHLARVNAWSPEEVREHIQREQELFVTRYQAVWDLDVSLITLEFGIDKEIADHVASLRWDRNVELAKQMVEEGLRTGEIVIIEAELAVPQEDPLEGFKWVR